MSTPRASASRIAIWWVAVVAWMAVIFVLSSQPDTDPAGVHRLPIGVYKLAHLTVFAVLGVLLVGATRHGKVPRAPWWSWVIVVLYAISDEIHQSFVPGRTSLLTDVGIDSLGGLLGIFGHLMLGSLREGRAWPFAPWSAEIRLVTLKTLRDHPTGRDDPAHRLRSVRWGRPRTHSRGRRS